MSLFIWCYNLYNNDNNYDDENNDDHNKNIV